MRGISESAVMHPGNRLVTCRSCREDHSRVPNSHSLGSPTMTCYTSPHCTTSQTSKTFEKPSTYFPDVSSDMASHYIRLRPMLLIQLLNISRKWAKAQLIGIPKAIYKYPSIMFISYLLPLSFMRSICDFNEYNIMNVMYIMNKAAVPPVENFKLFSI